METTGSATRTTKRVRRLIPLVGLLWTASALTTAVVAQQKPGPDGKEPKPVPTASIVMDQTIKHAGPQEVSLSVDIPDLAMHRADNLAASVHNPTDRTISVYKYAGYQGSCVNVAPRSSLVLGGTPVGGRQASAARAAEPCPEIVRVFSQPGFAGDQAVVSSSTTELSDLNSKLARSAIGVQNNTARPVAVFTGPDFTGRCHSVPAGGWVSSISVGEKPGTEERVRSVRLSAGCPAHDLNAMPDVNGDRLGDLVAIDPSGTSSKRIEVKVLSPVDTYKRVRDRFIGALEAKAEPMSFAVGDVNRDGYDDVIVIRPRFGKGGEILSGAPTVQAMSGRDHLRSLLFTRQLPFSVGPGWAFEAGDIDRDGWVDLVAFDNAAPSVRILAASARDQFTTVIADHITTLRSDPTQEFALADLRFDGVVDVLAIRQPVGRPVTVSVLSSSNRYRDVRATYTTPLTLHDPALVEFEAADTDGDRWVELLAISHHDAGSQRTAVFTLSSRNDFATLTGADFTALPPTSGAWQFE